MNLIDLESEIRPQDPLPDRPRPGHFHRRVADAHVILTGARVNVKWPSVLPGIDPAAVGWIPVLDGDVDHALRGDAFGRVTGQERLAVIRKMAADEKVASIITGSLSEICPGTKTVVRKLGQGMEADELAGGIGDLRVVACIST